MSDSKTQSARPSDERIAEYALGLLSEEEAAEIKALVAEDRALRLEVESYEQASADLAMLMPSALDASDGKEPALSPSKLLADANSPERFTPFVDEMVRLTEMSAAHAKKMLAQIDTDQGWDPPSIPGADIMHIDGDSPRSDGAEVGFVRLAPGATFPRHSHDGDEDYLVLQGACRDSNGRVYGAGDRVLNPAGSDHSFETIGNRPFIFVVVSRGISIL